MTHVPALGTAELQALVDRGAFLRDFNMRVTGVSYGHCTLVVPFQAKFVRPGGGVNGPVLMMAADVATWLAILTMSGGDHMAVTIEMKTMFINPATGSPDVHCAARVLKLGRRVVFGVAECTDGAGRLFAHHTLTYARDAHAASSAASRSGVNPARQE